MTDDCYVAPPFFLTLLNPFWSTIFFITSLQCEHVKPLLCDCLREKADVAIVEREWREPKTKSRLLLFLLKLIDTLGALPILIHPF